MKNNFKKVLSVALCLMMIFGTVAISGIQASAINTYLWVCGTAITDSNLTVNGTTSGTATYDPDTKTLTLDNFYTEAVDTEVINSNIDGLIIKVVSNSELTATSSTAGKSVKCIYAYQMSISVYVAETALLSVEAYTHNSNCRAYGIYANNIYINGTSVFVRADTNYNDTKTYTDCMAEAIFCDNLNIKDTIMSIYAYSDCGTAVGVMAKNIDWVGGTSGISYGSNTEGKEALGYGIGIKEGGSLNIDENLSIHGYYLDDIHGSVSGAIFARGVVDFENMPSKITNLDDKTSTDIAMRPREEENWSILTDYDNSYQAVLNAKIEGKGDKYYALTFDNNVTDNSVALASESARLVKDTDYAGTLPTLSRTGYKFFGWSTNKTASTSNELITDGSKYRIKADTELYAVWGKYFQELNLTCPGYKAGGKVGDAVPQTGTLYFNIDSYSWSYNGKTLSETDTFEAGKAYKLSVTVFSTTLRFAFSSGTELTAAGTQLSGITVSGGERKITGSATLETLETPVVVNPTEHSKIYIAAPETVDYRTKTKITARAEIIPEGYYLVISVNGKEVKSSGETVTYDCGELKGNISYSVKIVDSNGATQKDGNGNDLIENSEVECNSSFFKKLAAFFKGLFGSLPSVEIKP